MGQVACCVEPEPADQNSALPKLSQLSSKSEGYKKAATLTDFSACKTFHAIKNIRDSYKYDQKLGSGSFGSVYSATNKITG